MSERPPEVSDGGAPARADASRIEARDPVAFRRAAPLGVARLGGRAVAVTGIAVVIGLGTLALTLLDGDGHDTSANLEAMSMGIDEETQASHRGIDEALAAERALDARLDEVVPAEEETATQPHRSEARRPPAGESPATAMVPDLETVEIPPDDAPVMPVATAESRRTATRLFARSMRALDAGRLRLAAETGVRAWEHAPSDARLANHLASVHIERRDMESAETWCRRAIALDPELARAHTNLGAVLLAEGRPADAREAYERSLALVPGDWKALLGLASALHRTGDSEEAIATLERALEGAPHRAELWYTAAIVHEQSGDLDGAREAFGRYLALSRGADPARESKVREWLGRYGAESTGTLAP